MIDYKKEYESLTEGNNNEWFKPEQGVHKVTFLEDLGEPMPSKLKNDDGQPVMQYNVLVEVRKQRYKWTITKGETAKSLFGKLMYLGKVWGGLVGKVITLTVDVTDGKRDYSILEYTELRGEEKQQLKTITPAA